MSNDDQKTPQSLRMADLLLKKQLPILVRPRGSQESQSSLEANVAEDSMGSNSSGWLPTSQSSSRRGSQLVHSTGWQSPPATPPPGPASRTGSLLIDGIGCRFPTGLLSRASTLTVEGESVTAILATNHDVPDPRDSPSALEEDLLNTPRPEVSSFETPIRSAPPGGSIFGALPPLTPGLTPNCKRGQSPPSAPRPAKRLKVQTQQVGEDLENEVYKGTDFQGPAIDRVFRNLRRLTFDLIETTGCLVDTPEAEQKILGRDNTTSHTAPGSPRSDQVDRASEAGNFSSSEAGTTERATQPSYSIEVECSSEEEIQGHLAELLGAYRAFYLEPDKEEPPRPRDAESARRSQRILRAIFARQLSSDENEDFLFQQEEEDVLDVFLRWVRESHISSRGRQGTFGDLPTCLEQLGELAAAPFIRNILLSAQTSDGSLFTVQLPGCSLDGVVGWDLDTVHRAFALEVEELDTA